MFQLRSSRSMGYIYAKSSPRYLLLVLTIPDSSCQDSFHPFNFLSSALQCMLGTIYSTWKSHITSSTQFRRHGWQNARTLSGEQRRSIGGKKGSSQLSSGRAARDKRRCGSPRRHLCPHLLQPGPAGPTPLDPDQSILLLRRRQMFAGQQHRSIDRDWQAPMPAP